MHDCYPTFDLVITSPELEADTGATSGQFDDGSHMNAVAHAMLTLPAHKGQYTGVGGAASRGMRVKAFYVLLARAPESEDDMRSMCEVRTVGKEIVLVQVRRLLSTQFFKTLPCRVFVASNFIERLS